jgi:hypothetical protein
MTDGVPKSFQQALVHPLWGEPARKELDTQRETKALVLTSKEIALDAIHNQGADLVYMFPVYD